MASITRHKDRWRAHVYVAGHRKTKVFDTKREARDWAASEERRASRSKGFRSQSFSDAADLYEAKISSQKDGGTWEIRRLKAMKEHFGDARLSEIDTPQIADWRDKRLKTVSGSTVVREVNLLRNLFNVARLEWHWIEHKPFDGVKLPKENPPRHQVWGWRLIRRVLRAQRTGKTAEMIAAFHISLRTGMRLAEVLKAPEAFDPKRRLVTIKTKTEAAAQIPIGRIGAKLLARPAFIVGPNEGSVLFSALCKELLIEGLHFHDARATFLTHMSRRVDVLTLSKISRHKDIRILRDHYYRETAEQIAARI